VANRYANLVGANKIKDEWQKINAGFDAVQEDIDNLPVGLYRNAIINGNFDVWQRGTSFSTPNSFTADRWRFSRTGPGTTTISRSTDVPDGKSVYSLRFSGDYAPGDLQDIIYYMEGKDAAKFAGQQVTISLKQKGAVSAGSTSLQIYVMYATAPDNFVNIHQVGVSSPYSASGNFTEVVYTLTLPAVSGGYPISNGLAIIITHGGTTGTLTGNISQVQFCTGDVALPFQPRSFAEELALCQRYYEKSYDLNTVPGTATDTGCIRGSTEDSTPGGVHYHTVLFKVRKRAVPTVTVYGTDGTPNTVNDDTADRVLGIGSFSIPSEAGFSMNYALQGATSQRRNFHYVADAEL